MVKTILLADDSITIQKVVDITFADVEFEVVSFGDGAQALEHLDSVAPDLVIADVHMPGATGFEVCRAVKQRRPGTPVLLLVGTFEPFDADEARDAGAEGHLKKPFDSQTLLAQVESLIAAAATEAPLAPEPNSAPAPPQPASPQPAVAQPAAPQPAAPQPAAAPQSAPSFVAPPTPPRAFEPEFDPAPEPTPAPDASSGSQDGGSSAAASTNSASTNSASTAGGLSDDDVDRVARRVVELLSGDAVRDVAWEVVPDLAEVVLRERIRELESQIE